MKKAMKKLSIPVPLNDRIVVKPVSLKEPTMFGIIIPDSSKEKPEQGTVVAVGPGKWNEDGVARIPMSVEIGQCVMFNKYGYDEIKIDDEKYYVLSESNILAVVNAVK